MSAVGQAGTGASGSGHGSSRFVSPIPSIPPIPVPRATTAHVWVKASLPNGQKAAGIGTGVRVVFVGRDRPVLKRMALALVTFGVSRRVWLRRINKELDGHEALHLNHRAIKLLLAAPLLGLLLLAVLSPAIGPQWAALVFLATLVPGSVVAAQSCRRVQRMLEGSGVRFGPWLLVYLPGTVPLIGSVWLIGWVQSRLNRFWVLARKDPGKGVEVDVDLSASPSFRAEIGRALRESYFSGSRFDRNKERKDQARATRRRRWSDMRAQRLALRRAGGSTPLLPLRPTPPAKRVLHITCGRCEHSFDLVQDPLAETPVVCPECGLTEVLPSLRGDTPEASEPAAVASVTAACPACNHKFHAVRNLHGPTTLSCPACGKTEVLPPPDKTARKAAGAKKAKGVAKKAAKRPGKRPGKKPDRSSA